MKEIVINSADRASGTSTDFTVNLKKRLYVSQVGVLSANIFFTWYNITIENNQLDFSEGGGELTAVLTPGLYTTATLKTEIETQMNTVGALTYTLSFSTTTLKTRFVGTGIFSLLFGTGSHTITSVASILGYTGTDKIGGSLYWGDIGFNMNTLEYILVKLVVDNKTFGSVTSTNDADNNVANIAVIPIQVNPGYLLRYYSQNPPMTTIHYQSIDSLHIQLKSYGDKDLDLNGTEWSMVLRVLTTQGGI